MAPPNTTVVVSPPAHPTSTVVVLTGNCPRCHSMKKTRSNTTMIEQTHNQVPQEPTTDSTVAASLRTLTLCLDQLLNRESEETITYDGDEPAAHFFSQLESQPNFHNLEPARQARKALSSLRGEPRKIAQDLALLNKTYEEVKESLCAVYPRRPSFTLQEFYELKCTSMADIETYYKNKVRIGLAINLPKSAIVQALSNGVPRNYGNLLKMAQPSGPEEWLCLAQQLTYEGDNTSTKAAQQRSPRQSRTPSTAVDKTPPYPCRYCGGQHWHAQCQQRGPYQRTFRTFTPAVHSVEQPQRSTGPAGVYETAATTSSGETNRALRSYERNYTISELECLAIVECVDKFRVYLLGTRFVIYSDHHALQWLKTIKDPIGRLFRWSLRLSAYDYEVKYLKGSRQYEADLLSRNPFCGFLSTGQIKDHQGELRRDTRYILNDKDLMTIIRRGVTKIIVPPSLRGTLLQRAHRDFNHPGISQMTRLIAAQYYWDGMTNDIRTHVRTCSVCQLVKPPKGPIYGELGQLPPAVLPYELVSLDTISGFAKYGNSQTCLHVVVDHATRTDENVQKITDLIKENPRTTLLELEQDTGISKTTIGRIVTEDLKLKKTPAKFIPRFLTNEQKLCRLATCEDMMEMTRTDPEWKDKIITGDETWVYGYDPETKPQSAEWRDIAPNDFFLFPKLKAVLKERHFDTTDDIIEKSPLALKSIPKEAYKNCFDNWEKRWRWELGVIPSPQKVFIAEKAFTS
ncbi:K02A2.6-like [Cordylochernes scorpioides]|uniref:RNA-directed DNA polymerase n=1 Tax=Cordylochernes scorpioides TaxID=51811 RepID=A0ABY6K2I2_9ARAC|nr:K02A2.6-like [Cordylochernes scorpioides]